MTSGELFFVAGSLAITGGFNSTLSSVFVEGDSSVEGLLEDSTSTFFLEQDVKNKVADSIIQRVFMRMLIRFFLQ
ncbi:MAG: hypothetical protein CMO59_06250 [Verrucomicrobiales bacterium]|nr:hypothetical protein [Verrucomicrobiales bacterium]